MSPVRGGVRICARGHEIGLRASATIRTIGVLPSAARDAEASDTEVWREASGFRTVPALGSCQGMGGEATPEGESICH